MPRYMLQNILDSIVIVDLMGRFAHPQDADRILGGLIENYLRSYPGEERGQLKADILAAARKSASTIDNIKTLCRGMNGSERSAHVIAALERMLENMDKNARAKRSLFGRLFGGTRFHYETEPQTERVQRSRANIASAALAVFAKSLVRSKA